MRLFFGPWLLLENLARNPIPFLAEDVSGTAPTWGIQERCAAAQLLRSSELVLLKRALRLKHSECFPGGSLSASDALLGGPQVQRRTDHCVRCAWNVLESQISRCQMAHSLELVVVCGS